MTAPSLQWMDFANCQSSSLGAIPGNAKQCANQLKLDYDTIDHCVRGPLVIIHPSYITTCVYH